MKMITLILAILMVFGIVAPGYAEENESPFSAYQLENAIHLEPGEYTAGSEEFPTGEYILVIDNTNGEFDISFEYHCTEIPEQTRVTTIEIGQSFTMYVSIFRGDTLITNGSVDMYINEDA